MEIMECRGRMINKNWKTIAWVYVLKLEKGKWYVGATNNLSNRIYSHIYNRRTKWIKVYEVVQLHQVFRISHIVNEEYSRTVFRFENDKTIEFMKEYGWDNVRGGSYTEPIMEHPPMINGVYDGGTLERFMYG